MPREIQISIYGADTKETGSKADPKKVVYAVTENETRVLTIYGHIDEVHRPPVPYIAADAAEKSLMEPEHSEGESNSAVTPPTTQIQLNHPNHLDSVRFINKGAIYYSETLDANFERDTDSTGVRTNKPAKDTIGYH